MVCRKCGKPYIPDTEEEGEYSYYLCDECILEEAERIISEQKKD